MRRVVLLSAGFAFLAMLCGSPVWAGGQQQIVTSEQLTIGAPGGTFTFAGDVSDAGSFRFDAFSSAGPPAFFLSTEHLVQTYLGQAGTLTVQKECLSVFLGGGVFSDTCQAAVLGGTGAYEGAHGAGSCSGLLNLVTRIATQTCELRVTT